MFISSIIKNPKCASYEGKDKGEKILYIFRRSFITNIFWILFTLVLLVVPFSSSYLYGDIETGSGLKIIVTLFWYLFVVGYAFRKYLNWYFNLYIISTKKIVDIDFHGLLYKNISEAPVDNIEDVTSTVKGAFGMIFNIGDVFIQTAAEQREFDFHLLDNPSKVRDLVADLVADAKKRHGLSGKKDHKNG